MNSEAGRSATAGQVWDEILRAQRRLDRVPLRRWVKAVLRAESPALAGREEDDLASDPLRGWQRLGQALHTGNEDPLDRYVAAYEVDGLPGVLRADEPVAPVADRPWPHRAACVVDALLAMVPDDRSDRAELVALVLGFCYLECIVFWEYTSQVEPLRHVLRVVSSEAAAAAGAARASQDGAPSSSLLDVIGAASVALERQFDVEDDGWMCGCPVKVASASADAADALARALALAEPGPSATDPASDLLTGLGRVVRESVEDAHRYMVLLADHVAPAAIRFVDNLSDRFDDDDLVDALHRAIAEVDGALGPVGAPAVGAPPAIAGVFRTEARAQRRALAAMLELVTSDPPQPSLVVEQGEIHFLYPFTLPVDESGVDEVQHRLRAHFAGGAGITTRPRLAGRPVAIEDALQTEVFSQAAEAFELDDGQSATMRLVFADDRLVLETAAGARYEGLDVEVVVGSLGNHLVRIAITTAVAPRWCTNGPGHGSGRRCDGSFERGSGAWTPHEIDQFLHRAGLDFGPERLFFVGDGAERHDPPADVWPSAIGLAARIVSDLHQIVRELPVRTDAALPPDAPVASEWVGSLAGRDDVLDPDERAAQLRQLAHVLIVLNDCVAVADGQRRAVADPGALVACRGSAPVLAPQPPCPRVLEEWTCLPAVRTRADGSDGLLSSMDSWTVCHGDTTLMFAPASPNWQVIEDRELVMFALSLGSVYVRTRDRLLASAREASEKNKPQDLSDLPRRQLEADADDVRRVEVRLKQQIAFADRLQSQAAGASMIRPRRDRTLLDHLGERSGVQALEAAMVATKDLAADRQSDLRDTVGAILEAQRRRGQSVVERLLLAVAFLALIDLFWWYFDMHSDPEESVPVYWNVYYWVVVAILASLVGLVVFSLFRRERGASAEGSDALEV